MSQGHSSERTTTVRFPEGFLWGAATAAYQIEGGAEDGGRGRSVWDDFSHTEGKVAHGHTGDIACDHYHRLDEDLALMADLGLQSYRFSISWSRVLPGGFGEVNREGLDFYHRLVDGLLARGIVPNITLFHWDLPSALEEHGGFRSRDTVHWFADYAALIARELGDRAPMIATLSPGAGSRPTSAKGWVWVIDRPPARWRIPSRL